MRWTGALVLVLALGSPARAQGRDAFERIAFRVLSAARPGEIVVDRGSGDGLAVGDPATLRPPGGPARPGRVVEVEDRTAVIELDELAARAEIGMRGEVVVPRARLALREREREDEGKADTPEHPPWADPDEGWTPDMPLLAQLRAVRPEERRTRVGGRVYVATDVILTDESDQSDMAHRAGADVVWENPFGRGGELHADGEVDHLHTSRNFLDDLSDVNLRIDRLSYTLGDTRFDRQRLEAGRFLIRGMPEFGVIDGFEWGWRFDGGHRVGASIGFLPELDENREQSLETFQVSAYYDWVVDEDGRLAFGLGAQKAWHDSGTDRDLVVAKARYAPLDGWRVDAVTWVDLYDSDDGEKSVAELTHGVVSVGRTFEDGDSIDVTLRHQRFPQLEREEFAPVLAEQLDDDFHDRLSVGGWKTVAHERRLHGEVGAWVDQDDAGGDVECGLELGDFLGEEGRADVALFANRAKFAFVTGVRASYDRTVANGRWGTLYELAWNRQDDFSDDRDDLYQHRVRGSFDLRLAPLWTTSFYLEARVWDEELSASLGLHLERSF